MLIQPKINDFAIAIKYIDGKFDSGITIVKGKMFLRKSKQLKIFSNKSNLDQVLFFIENYLPHKKDRANRKDLPLDMLKTRTINQIQKLASLSSKSLTPNATNTKVSVTLGSWALPYLKLLKQIGLAK